MKRKIIQLAIAVVITSFIVSCAQQKKCPAYTHHNAEQVNTI